MSKIDEAATRFDEGHSCSQAILATYGPPLGITEELALKLASPFGSGMARLGETCGVVTGALMTIGLKYEKVVQESEDSRSATYDLAGEFLARFTARHGSLCCRELIGCDLSTPEGCKHARTTGLYDKVCANLVREGAAILGELL